MQQPQAQNRNNYYAYGGARIRPVSSFEEVKAASIDFDGSVFYFPDLANKRIYTKQIGLDGIAILNMYELKDTPTAQPTSIDMSQFITREEFEKVIKQIAVPATQSAEPVQGAPTQNGKEKFEF